MKLAQIYTLEMSEDNRQNARPGQFIFTGHDFDETVIGFIGNVDLHANEMEMWLFEPRQIPSIAKRVIAEVCDYDDVAKRLREICDEDEDVRSAWIDLANEPDHRGLQH